MKNIAFISVDDLINVVRFRDAYGTPFQTPSIDRLLAMGTYFDNAHAVVPACNPSRTATLTGQSPFHNGVEENAQRFFETVDPETTLPALLRQAGYTTVGIGKVFHDFPAKGKANAGIDAFLDKLYDHYEPSTGDRIGGNITSLLEAIGPGTMRERDVTDTHAVEWAADFVRSYDSEKPWFLSLGLVKPHLNWNVPKKYYDRFDPSKIAVPDNLPDDYDDVPLFYQQFLDGQRHAHDKVVDAGLWVDGIHAYLAAVAYADDQIGTFLDSLDAADAWDDTTVMLWSDHGFHLGDKEVWGKFTHWEQGTNAPLIVVDPDHGRPGTVVRTPVSLLDVLPTLVELVGVRDGGARDGRSLVPLLDDPRAPWDGVAASIMDGSVSIRTERHRYILSLDGEEQLYDMRRDPDQLDNLAGDPAHGPQLEALRARTVVEMERFGGLVELDGRSLHGTAGDDVVLLTPNLEEVAGGDGDDLYLGLSGDAIREAADGGTDTLRVFSPRSDAAVELRIPEHVERVVAYQTSIDLHGSDRRDVVLGDGGGDRIGGRAGVDRLNGGDGDDLIRGGHGGDLVVGKAAADRLLGGAGGDRIAGSGGRDLLRGGPGADRLAGGDGDDLIRGGHGGDLVVGRAAADRLLGGAGGDRIAGGGGRDLLRGGPGADRLAGGESADLLRGGPGADRFVFVGGGVDRIGDFDPGRDRLDLGPLGLDGAGDVEWSAGPQGELVASVAAARLTIVLEGLAPDDLPRIDLDL